MTFQMANFLMEKAFQTLQEAGGKRDGPRSEFGSLSSWFTFLDHLSERAFVPVQVNTRDPQHRVQLGPEHVDSTQEPWHGAGPWAWF